MKEEKLKVKHIKEYYETNYAFVIFMILFAFGYGIGYAVYYLLITFSLMDKPLIFFCSVIPVIYAVSIAIDRKDEFKFTTESIIHQEVKKNEVRK